MIAILSDIHGNLEAFLAVLEDINSFSVRAIYNLGDTVGYGPNPLECLDLSRQLTVNLMGNFDYAVLFGADGFGMTAEKSVYWCRDLLGFTNDDICGTNPLVSFLRSRFPSLYEHQTRYVHASPRNPMNEYLLPEDIHNEQKMRGNFAQFDKLCFNGHSHIPGIFAETKSSWEYTESTEVAEGFPINNRRLICNVGSVGQPRDDDWRASYALFDDQKIQIRRVQYDVESTIQKIYAIPELDDFLGDRLRLGR